MAFSVKDNLTFTGTGTATSVHLNNVANGDTSIVFIAVNQSSTGRISSVTDSSSNTYQKAAQFAGTNIEIECWYSNTTTFSNTTTLTITPAVGTDVWSATWVCASGIVSLGGLDQRQGASGTSVTSIDSTATATTRQANEIVFGFGGQANNRPWTAGSGYTSINQAANGTSASVFAEYKTVTSTGTYNATATIDVASNLVMGVVTFADTAVPATVIDRYVNTASTSGGDGTTSGTSGANRAYPTLNVALAALAQDLVYNTSQVVIHCQGTADSTQPSFSGWTTNKLYYLTVQVDSANRAAGYPDTTKYYLNSNIWGIVSYPAYTRFIGIQLQNSGDDVNLACWSAGNGATSQGSVLIDCIGWYTSKNRTYGNRHGYFGGTDATYDPQILINCVFYLGTGTQGRTGNYGIGSTNGNLYAYNCTVDGGATSNDSTAVAFSDGYARVTTKNCIAINFPSIGNAHGTGTDYTATDCAAAGNGSHSRASQTFSFVNASIQNYQLTSSDTGAKGYGEDLSADATYAFNYDIVGSTRSTPWDIGAWKAQGGTSYTKTLAETLTMSDVLLRSITKLLAESTTISDTLTRSTTKALSESTTISDVISRATTKLFSETATITDTLKRATTKLFSEVATITDTLTANKVAQAVAAAFGALATFALGGVPVAGGQKKAGTLWTKVLTEVATITDTFIKGRIFTEAITVTDTLVKQITKLFTESITVTDAFSKLRTAFKTFTESITITDSITRSISRSFTEAITITDTLLRTIARTFSESVTITDTLAAFRARVINLLETITVTDTLSKAITKLLAESITISDVITALRLRVANLVETITITDVFIKGRIFGEVITVTDSFVKSITKKLTESTVITDTLTFAHTIGRIFTETLTITDSLVRSITKKLTELITISDVVTKLVNGASVIWSNITRSATSAFSKGSKSTSTFTKSSRSSSNWTKEIKD